VWPLGARLAARIMWKLSQGLNDPGIESPLVRHTGSRRDPLFPSQFKDFITCMMERFTIGVFGLPFNYNKNYIIACTYSKWFCPMKCSPCSSKWMLCSARSLDPYIFLKSIPSTCKSALKHSAAEGSKPGFPLRSIVLTLSPANSTFKGVPIDAARTDVHS